MDHLPRPIVPSWTAPEVPLFGLRGYDNGNISTYLGRRGMDEETLIGGLLSSDHKQRIGAHAILQEWTYFGVLNSVLEEDITPRDLLKRVVDGKTVLDDESMTEDDFPEWVNDVKTMLDTTSLTEKVSRWIIRTTEMNRPLEERRAKQSQMVELFLRMSNVYQRIYNSLGGSNRRNQLDGNFMLSIALLYDYLDRAGRSAYGPWSPEHARETLNHRAPELTNAMVVVDRQLKINGWCKMETNLIGINPLEDWYLSFLNVPHPEKDHSLCTDMKCLAYQIDEKTYSTKHVEDNCQCEFVYSSQDMLYDILVRQGGAFPLIQIVQPQRSRGGDARLYISLTASKDYRTQSTVKYVAISHVWSDGLGNNKENAIPLCQFDRLSALVSKLYNGRPVAFWLDTLCFPLKPQDAYDMALVRMKESYEDSDKVLVLDQYLLDFSVQFNNPSLDEVAARIIISPWNRRLWTYQEAHLAKRRHLFFQFADGFVGDGLILDHFNRDLPMHRIMETWIFLGISAEFKSIRDNQHDISQTNQIIRAKESLTYRSTSQIADQGLCLGNIVGIDPQPLVDAKTHAERMEVFWALAVRDPRDYHASFIFWEGPKLKTKGYRWAPSTLMDASSPDAQSSWPQLNDQVLGRSELGLHVRLAVLALRKFTIGNKRLYYLKLHHQRSDQPAGHFAFQLDQYANTDGTNEISRVWSWSVQFVILLPFPWRMMDSDAAKITDVQLAAISAHGGNRLRLKVPGMLARLDAAFDDQRRTLLRVGDDITVRQNELYYSRINWISASLIEDSEWHVD